MMNQLKVNTDAYRNLVSCVAGVFFQPYLYTESGLPWFEANCFLFYCSTQGCPGFTNSEDVRRKASILQEYRNFIYNETYTLPSGETIRISLYDFSSPRMTARPTYKYFLYLRDIIKVNKKQLNMKTKVVYDFYNFLCTKLKYPINMEMVSKTSTESFRFETSSGYRFRQFIKRDQAIYTSTTNNPVPDGFVRDDGEDLRPLDEHELYSLVTIILNNNFDILAKLAIDISLSTGARKQTIFTLRKKHIEYLFLQLSPQRNNVNLKAGPGTGIDTKNNKPYVLFFPTELIKSLAVYINSPHYKSRLERYRTNYNDNSDDNAYVFLSRNGNPFYMAKDDIFYKMSKTKPSGTMTSKWTKKIIMLSNGKIPASFNFHWLRATFAKQLFKKMVLINTTKEKKLSDSDIITSIQNIMNHTNRKTTENYLKLFTDASHSSQIQNLYENYIFYSDKPL